MPKTETPFELSLFRLTTCKFYNALFEVLLLAYKPYMLHTQTQGDSIKLFMEMDFQELGGVLAAVE